MTPRVVRAAGGVVGRAGSGGTEIVLVHRPRYGDWSLPKGKLDRGEHPLLAGVREVREETGVRAVPRLKLPATRYLTGDPHVEKAVDFWVMDCREIGALDAGDEVDEVRWVPVGEAAGLLTYAHDRGVVSAYPRLARARGLVILVRHAYAGERSDWDGNDLDRPLDHDGRATAAGLAPVLAAYEPTRIVSARPDRCTQTVEPLAARTGLALETDPRFDETTEVPLATAAVRELAAAGGVTVVCSQGRLIPGVVGLLAGRDRSTFHTTKGAAWVLGFAGTEFVAADRLEP